MSWGGFCVVTTIRPRKAITTTVAWYSLLRRNVDYGSAWHSNLFGFAAYQAAEYQCTKKQLHGYSSLKNRVETGQTLNHCTASFWRETRATRKVGPAPKNAPHAAVNMESQVPANEPQAIRFVISSCSIVR